MQQNGVFYVVESANPLQKTEALLEALKVKQQTGLDTELVEAPSR